VQALAAELVGLEIHVLERVERQIGRAVDRLRDRAVDIALSTAACITDMLGRRQALGVDEIIRQRRVGAVELADTADRRSR